MKRKLLAMFLASTMVLSLTACGNASTSTNAGTEEDVATGDAAESEESTEADKMTTTGVTGETIELEYNVSGAQLDTFKEIVQGFTDKTGIGVTVTSPGNNYENAMKTRMASGDLPDMWVTHGWSVIRYSEYLMPLEDQDWYNQIDASLLPSITDADGHIYVLPITEAVCGVIYNKDVVESAGVDVSAIRNWDDFSEALAKVSEGSDTVSPLYMSCNDSAVNAYTLEDMFPTFYSNSDITENSAEALKDGSFDFTSQGRDAFELLAGWADAGYFNKDALTADLTTAEKAIGNGEAAFMFYSTECIPTILTYCPDANLGVMPVPASGDAGSYFGVGEGNFSNFAISKDTTHEEECKQFLSYMAEPENADKLAIDVDGGIPCLSTSQITDSYVLNAFKEAQSQFDGDLIYDNFFDREYLPSGMWSVMDDSMDILFDGTPKDNVDKAVDNMQTNYSDLL